MSNVHVDRDLRISKIFDNNFINDNPNYDYEFKFNDSLKNSLLLLNNLNNSINKAITQSVMDLTNCFICLSPAKDPLNCPYCNNFACKNCLQIYFEKECVKRCPLCKRDIKFDQLKNNQIVQEIEDILNKEDNKKVKYMKLSEMINLKKMNWENQANNISYLVDKLFLFQENLQKYKNQYYIFILQIQNLIDKTFQELNTKIEKLINSLLTYNKVADDSIQKYNTIYQNNQNHIYNNNNIKNLINEIFSLERKRFNDIDNNETKEFLYSNIQIIPSINIYHIRKVTFQKSRFEPGKTFFQSGNHFKLGDYTLNYKFDNNYKINCDFNFTIRNTKKMCFIISQNLVFNIKREKMILMEIQKSSDINYSYKCNIPCEEMEKDENEVNITTEALIFTI